jgi:membrane-associated protease RseP (regulator of RpoE activity)
MTNLLNARYLIAPFSSRGILVLTLILFTVLTMIIHELGHLVAAKICRVRASEIGLGLGPRLFGFRMRQFEFSLRALPVASYLRIDGAALKQRTIVQQLLIHLGGVMLNLLVALAAQGTMFGWINLMLAAANLLPLYKHDGWKCGVVLVRALLRKQSQPVEWVFTFSGGVASLVIVSSLIHFLK